MSIKQEIINKINRIDDPELLFIIDRWINSILNASVTEDFSNEEIVVLQEAYKQYKAGNILSQEKARKLFNQWLKEKTSSQPKSVRLGYTKEFEELYGSVTDESFTEPG